jgi:hypothetical protein
MADTTNLATQASAVPQPKPVDRKSRKAATQASLSNLVTQQVRAEVEAVRAVVSPAASAIVEVYAAIPEIVHGEAMQLLEARLPQIEASSDLLADEIVKASQAAIAAARQISQDFLSQGGES